MGSENMLISPNAEKKTTKVQTNEVPSLIPASPASSPGTPGTPQDSNHNSQYIPKGAGCCVSTDIYVASLDPPFDLPLLIDTKPGNTITKHQNCYDGDESDASSDSSSMYYSVAENFGLSLSPTSSNESNLDSQSSVDTSTSKSTLMSLSSSSKSSLVSSDSFLPISNASDKSTNASGAWLCRRQRMNNKRATKQMRDQEKKLKDRDTFIKTLSRKTPGGPVHSTVYIKCMKDDEKQARAIASLTSAEGKAAPTESLVKKVKRRMLFELFHSLPASVTMFIYCITHVAIYEFFQMFVQDFLELNEYENQNLVYTGVLLVALIKARLSGWVYEFSSDEEYESVKFDMHNSMIRGDLDARLLRWFKNHPELRNALDVVSLYLCYLSANHLVTEYMMKTFLDVRQNVLADLPSMKYPDVSTHIKSVLSFGEEMFEDSSLPLSAHLTSSSSLTACDVLGGDLCDDRVLKACESLQEWRANLTVADGDWLYDEVSFATYYKIIGDTSAGIFYYESGMVALFLVFLIGAGFLKRRGIGFWEDR